MIYNIEEKQDKRIGIFTDIHVGVSSDSKIRLDETKKCIKWIIKQFKEESVDWVIFCGDLFNSRYSINVNTLNIGIELVEDLAYNFEKVFLIEGNHDTYYKNSNSVNSVKFFQKIGRNDNIFVIDEHPLFVKLNDVTLGLYPWGFTPDSSKEIENFKTPDYGFGHFEMNGIEMVGSVSSGSKFNMSNMFTLGNMLYSGHYHGNKLYKDIKQNKLLYMIGSPLQLDWGDYLKEKKILVFNSENQKLKEIKNTVNAEFRKIFYSSFEKGEYTDKKLKDLCYHNFIKFVIDKQYKFDDILNFNERIKKYDPYSLELDYLISMSNGVINESAEEIIKANSKTNKDYLIDYLDNIFSEYEKVDESLDLNYLKTMAISYYDKSQMSKDERNEEIEL